LLSAVITIVMFLIMISLHEFGHFITGKLLGFNVIEYAIGFGPAIFKYQGKKTLYSIRIIPFGGFCQFDGEDEESDADGAFNSQPPYKRFIVLVAGAAFNILLGFIIYICLTLNTGQVYTNTVDVVIEHTSLYESGVIEGDEIISIDSHNIGSYRDIQLYTMNMQEGEPFEVGIKRDGKKQNVTITPTKQTITATYTENEILYTETIGDSTESINIPYSDKNKFDPEKVGTTQTSERLLIGFSPVIEDVTWKNIIPEAYNQTCFVVKLVYTSLFDLITGDVGMDAVSGPIGVAAEVDTAVKSDRSWLNVISIVALLTINLGVMNLLPLPALDGGRILFVIIEWIRRKPIPRDKEGIIHGIGFMLLFAFMIFVFFQDILKLLA